MTGRAVALAGASAAAALAAGAVAVDRVLAGREDEPPAIDTFVVIDAPIERVWARLADIERQPEWMAEMKAVRLLTPPPVAEGTRGEATVRILGFAVTDPVTITRFEAPSAFEIAHEGAFGGRGAIALESGSDRRSTIVRWSERLVPPLLPHLGARLQAPVLRAIFQADLHRLRRLLEAPAASAAVDPSAG